MFEIMTYLDIIWKLASSGDPIFWIVLVMFIFIVAIATMGSTYHDYAASCRDLFYILSNKYPAKWKEIGEPVLWVEIYLIKKQKLMMFIASLENLQDEEINILCAKIRREYYVTNFAGLVAISSIPVFIILSMFI